MSGDLSISVVIPVFNGERFLAEAISGVLAQTRPASEILVIDDGSTDGTAAVAAGFGGIVRHVLVEHGGPPAARNRGVAESRGRFIAFLDHDDLWLPDKLEVQLAAASADPPPDVVLGLMEEFAESGSGISLEALGRPRGPLSALAGSAALIARESFQRVGPFNERSLTGDFIDWCARAADAGLRTAVPQRVVVRRRIHGANMGFTHGDRYRGDYLALVKAALDRRRALAGRRAPPEPPEAAS